AVETIVITADHTNGVYKINQPIHWHVQTLTNFAPETKFGYTIKKGGFTILQKEKLALTNGAAEIEIALAEPETVLLEIKAKLPDGTSIKALGGAVVDPHKIKPSQPSPKDFDTFWKSKIKELKNIAPNPQLVSGESDRTNTLYWQITMDNIRGTHVRGQIARPVSGKKFPAMLIVQGAGVYALHTNWVTSPASKGWLALNISAHDLPVTEPDEFYKEQAAGALKNYWEMGNEDREQSYFLRMYLACYRAAEYLAVRPDWDGKTLLVIGTSQGGLQSLLTASLYPKITAAIAHVPGGCDLTRQRLGDSPGWPVLFLKNPSADTNKVLETSRYFDIANFASRIKCPVLVSAGLIDEVCPAAGIFAAVNQIKSPKEIIILPQSDHMGTNDSHRPFALRSAYWQTALLAGKNAPVNKIPPEPEQVVVKPKPYSGAIRNPLMGFIGPINGKHEYATLAREYVKWNQIENSASDGVEKLRAYSDTHWSHVAEKNIKIIPRVFLEWPKGSGSEPYWPIDSYWPADLPRDWNSAQFKERTIRMIQKMGEAWDNDPRIAFIEMGIIGPWGEQHHPSPDLEMQKLLGDAFQKAFNNKLVMNRYPWQFTNYNFGIHWDSFGNPGWEMKMHVPEFEGLLAERWKTVPMGGEMAFETYTNSPKPRFGKTPTDAVFSHADKLIQYIRRWHWTELGWVSNYDAKNSVAARNAERVQSAFGYRFALDEVRYQGRTEPGELFKVSFDVRNLGSAPIYFNWPVEVSLLNPATREVVWKANFKDLDIRKWLPGNFSDKGKGRPVGDKANFG
ncbi:MAG: acetylxylan esterase, partial [Verrucomicrobiota bacterium]